MGGGFASCCSIAAKGEAARPGRPQKNLPEATRTISRKVANFRFSHVFSVANPGKIDEFYDVSKTETYGGGSSGMVYRAVHKDSKVPRAVKSVANSINEGELPAEVLVLRSMDHPNIIKLHETFQDAKQTYLVMEVCSGGQLLDTVIRTSSSGNFTENQAATYLEQILASITYMHSSSIAHRDIRSENFLLQDSGERAEVKLIDFVLATQCEGDMSLKTVCGTSHYMAPEVLQGAYSRKCDIWSCGVFLYIMLLGSPPFDGADDEQILKAVEAGVVTFPAGEGDAISQCAKDFIGMMLVKDPNLRSDAETLIRQQFIRRGDVAGRQPLPSVVKKLKSFNNSRQLKKVCLTVIAKHLTKNDIEDLRLIFKTLDKNSDGTITKKEMMDGLGNVAQAVPGMDTNELSSLCDSIDSDGSGSIDYTEFLAAAMDRKVYQQRDVVWSAFRTFDADGSGKIEKSELKALMESTGQTDVTDAKVAELLAEADKNKDGFLDFEEFMAMIQEE